MAVSTLFYGSLSDRYGRRPVLLSGLALFLIGSALSAVATSVVPLVLGRLVQAIGAGCGLTLGRVIAKDVYGPDRLVKAWRAARSLAYVPCHQAVDARNISCGGHVIKPEVVG